MPVEIFCCYARRDQSLLNELKAHLMPLQRQGYIKIWADTDIGAGIEWEKEIEKHLNSAQIILLLVSPDFINSDYCYGKEMKRAIERHELGEARVIPVILRHVYWQGVLGKLQALPTDGKPIGDADKYTQDKAFLKVAEGIRKVVEELPTQSTDISSAIDIQLPKSMWQLDIDAVAEEATELEKQFLANGYRGRRNGPYILEVRGTLPVVISAPHAVRCGIKVQNKQTPQMYTGALAIQLATLTGASALVSARTSDEDPNRDEPGEYKPKLATFVRETPACFVLDLHGSDENFVKEKQLGQVEIGTIYNKSLRGKRFLRKMLEETLENAGITVTVDKYFTADAPGTITLYTSEGLDTSAMQLQITRSFRDPEQTPEKYVKLLRVLSNAIIAMHKVCSETKN
jgi:hypothetical protein